MSNIAPPQQRYWKERYAEMLEMPSEKAYGVAMESWRSPVDIPRDGSIIAVLMRGEDYSTERRPIIRAEALMFGEDPDHEAYWYVGGDWSFAYESAAELDPMIIGWFPLPQIAEWEGTAITKATALTQPKEG